MASIDRFSDKKYIIDSEILFLINVIASAADSDNFPTAHYYIGELAHKIRNTEWQEFNASNR